MQVSLERQPIEQVASDALITIVFQDTREDRLGLGELCDAGEITGKAFEMTLLHNVPGMRSKRLLAVGAGKPDKFTAAELRRAVGAAVRHLKSKSIRDAAVWLDARHAASEFVSAAVEGAILADFETDRYKTDKKDAKAMARFSVAVAGGGPHLDAARGARPHHRRGAEFHARAGQRAGQSPDAAGAGGTCPPHGGRIRPGMRSAGSRAHGAARHGSPAGRGAGQRRAAGADRDALPARGRRLPHPCIWDWWAKASPSTPAASPSSRPTAWRR